MKVAAKLEITTPSDREIAMIRTFDAPPDGRCKLCRSGSDHRSGRHVTPAHALGAERSLRRASPRHDVMTEH